MRHALAEGIKQMVDKFQSQTRSRSTCDFTITRAPSRTAWFQSQTRSRSTCDTEVRDRSEGKWPVSISDEKPLHMRPKVAYALFWLDKLFQSQTRSRSTCDIEQHLGLGLLNFRFNLRREAAPHATRPVCPREPWGLGRFNLRREAAPHATRWLLSYSTTISPVSISDEKPLHMRLATIERGRSGCGWVSISDEKPLHMRHGAYRLSLASIKCFNLRREAAPHATPVHT